VLERVQEKWLIYKFNIVVVRPKSHINFVHNMKGTWKKTFQLWHEHMGHVHESKHIKTHV
jgi:hypothetical protein